MEPPTLKTFTLPSGENLVAITGLQYPICIQDSYCPPSILGYPSLRQCDPLIPMHPPPDVQWLASAQRNPKSIATQTNAWIKIILSYARHRRLFFLRARDADLRTGGDWSDIFYNPRIKRNNSSWSYRDGPTISNSLSGIGSLPSSQLETLIQTMVTAGQAVYEPAGQKANALLLWRRPEEWAEILHEWVGPTLQAFRSCV